MSKLQERLERVASGPSRPLGFSFGNRESLPPLVIVTRVTSGTLKTAENTQKAAVKGGSEFILVDGAAAAKSPPKTGDTPWGARVDSLTEKELGALREAGCDFLFVSLGDTPVRLLNDESLGYFGVVPADLDERRLRAIDRLPFEGNVMSRPRRATACRSGWPLSTLLPPAAFRGTYWPGRPCHGASAKWSSCAIWASAAWSSRSRTRDRRPRSPICGRPSWPCQRNLADAAGERLPGCRRWRMAQALRRLMTAMMTMILMMSR